jgi:plastocyanin
LALASTQEVRENVLRIITVAVVGLLLTGCLSSEPKVSEDEQVSAEQRAALEATEGGGAGGGGEGGGGGGAAAEWVAVDIAYDQAPTELTAGTVNASLTNQGAIEHNVVIEELGDEKILDAPAGETVDAEVELEPGEYTFYCDVAGHREAGMEGTLTVTE